MIAVLVAALAAPALAAGAAPPPGSAAIVAGAWATRPYGLCWISLQ